MKLLFCFLQLSLITFYSEGQIIIDRNRLAPVEVNNSYFDAVMTVTPLAKSSKVLTMEDIGMGIGQIYTYKGAAKDNMDLQSLVLIEKKVFDSIEGRFIKCFDNDIVHPYISYNFKVTFACMSRVAEAPKGQSLNAKDLKVSGLRYDPVELSNILKGRNSIFKQYVEQNDNSDITFPDPKIKAKVVPPYVIDDRRPTFR